MTTVLFLAGLALGAGLHALWARAIGHAADLYRRPPVRPARTGPISHVTRTQRPYDWMTDDA